MFHLHLKNVLGSFFIRQLATSHRMSSILVYSGKGSDKQSNNLLYSALRDSVNHRVHKVQYISAAELREGKWMSHTKVICFGGGYDLGFIESLGSTGLRNVREFVSSGGSYLGICAGAYFACDFIEFDKNGSLEVCGERSLKFYPGKGIGPAVPGFDYNSRKGVHAVPLLYKDRLKLDAYMDGGGYFLPYNSSTTQFNTEVLGKFESLENVPEAIVKCEFGQGCAILSGAHLEFSVHHLNHEDQYLKKLLPDFYRAEEKRKYVFTDLLSQLGVICCDNDTHIDCLL